MGLAAFARRGAADHLGTVVDRGLRMEGAVLAGEALADDLGVLVDEDGHQFEPFTAFTIFCAASSRSSADVTLRLDLAMISLPFSTLVPSSRTTSGTRRPTSFTAVTTPSAMTSDRKSTRLNSSHQIISYAVFCLKKKTITQSSDS